MQILKTQPDVRWWQDGMQTVLNESDCIKYVWHNISKVGMEKVVNLNNFGKLRLLDSVSKNQNDL